MPDGVRAASRWRAISVALVVLVAAAAAGFFAARATLIPPRVDEGVEPPTLVEVVEGTVEQFQSFTAQARWDAVPAATAGLSGTVTSVGVEQGAALAAGQGSILYTIDLVPVVVFAGAVPAFRDLEVGVSGADVGQLQEGLAALGFASGPADGRFDSAVASAVRAWQSSLGLESSGRVVDGQVRFISTLPATVVLADGITVGRELSGAEDAILVLPTAPDFSIPLSPDQRNLVPLDAAVAISHPGGEWPAMILRVTELSEDGQPVLRLHLGAVDGAAVCAQDCDLVAVRGITDFPARIIVVPTTTGPLVPAAAVQTDALGATSVVLADGGTRAVTILAQAQGRAVVDGVEVGEQIQLPAPGG